jgi:hypothetical protein
MYDFLSGLILSTIAAMTQWSVVSIPSNSSVNNRSVPTAKKKYQDSKIASMNMGSTVGL